MYLTNRCQADAVVPGNSSQQAMGKAIPHIHHTTTMEIDEIS